MPEQPDFVFLSEAEDGWRRLLQADWELAPNTEGYRCVRFTVPEDVYISALRPVNPPGTHHTTLEIDDGVRPDGVTLCGPGQATGRVLHAAGAGSDGTSLPDETAMKIAKGQQLFMNLHLFNLRDEPLGGTSGMWVKTTSGVDDAHEAEIIIAGPLSLSIPPGKVIQTGECTFSHEVKLFSVAPHMHQLGSYITIRAHSSLVGDVVLLDQSFDFNHQLVHPLDLVPLAVGDRVSVECTYVNETNQIVHWGNSTLDEMCFAMLGLYPAAGTPGLCVN